MVSGALRTSRILIVSNRLPYTFYEKEGKLRFKESAGGLVSGLSAYLDSLKSSSLNRSDYVWIGWPGITVTDEGLKQELKLKLHSTFHAYPVLLSENEMENFYHGFCNKTIWPLFHYFPSYTVYNEDYWHDYKKVNEIFRDTLMEIMRPDDIVWVHDYHLMLLPKLLREKLPTTPIGFFLHIPFPSYEIFRLLPGKWRKEILEGLLGADLIGFHTHDYTQYFLRSVLRILGYEHDMGRIILSDRLVKADTFPMGIDFHRFQNAAGSAAVEKEKRKLRKMLSAYKVILSIDRLDYTKGIINRLRGYETFLEKNPQWWQKVILILVVVPSRIGVEHYQQMKREIDELVGNINGKFGSLGWTPVLYQYKFLPFDPLVALYNYSDVVLLTPLRDGMNLIAKEYIASRTACTGVLILSEMAGASKELREAIIINPNNKEEIADALKEALEIPEAEQVRRNQIMQSRLSVYNVVRWAEDFISQLLKIKEDQKALYARLLTPDTGQQLACDYRKSKRRLILLDYDGTLVTFSHHPQAATPSEEVIRVLKRLSEDPRNDVVIISGRDKDTLQEWFSHLPVGLAAEHGIWVKERGQQSQLIKPVTNIWKSQIRPILDIYTARLPGSFIEEKEFSVAWHYRGADPELGSLQAKELADDLISFTANVDLQVVQGSKVVEVRNAGVTKGTATLYWIAKNSFDFILAIGDDLTDGDLFKVLPETAYSIRVGITLSHARYNLPDCAAVIQLLKQLANSNQN